MAVSFLDGVIMGRMKMESESLIRQAQILEGLQ